jgi:hypothetical protein
LNASRVITAHRAFARYCRNPRRPNAKPDRCNNTKNNECRQDDELGNQERKFRLLRRQRW